MALAKMPFRGRFLTELAIVLRDYKGKVGAGLVKIGALYLHQKEFRGVMKKLRIRRTRL